MSLASFILKSHNQQCRVDKLPRMGSVESHGLLAIRLWELYRCYQACHLIRAVEIEDPVNHRFWSFWVLACQQSHLSGGPNFDPYPYLVCYHANFNFLAGRWYTWHILTLPWSLGHRNRFLVIPSRQDWGRRLSVLLEPWRFEVGDGFGEVCANKRLSVIAFTAAEWYHFLLPFLVTISCYHFLFLELCRMPCSGFTTFVYKSQEVARARA